MRPMYSGFGLLFVFFSLLQPACASPWKTGSIYNGRDGAEVRLDGLASSVRPGAIVIVSENHGFVPHHENQYKFLESLASAGLQKISVGMEFFARTFQAAIDSFLLGNLAEADFLKQVEWGSNKFEDYRRQVLFPAIHQGRTLGLNAPRALTGRISKVGIQGLTAEEKAQIPPNFQLGNSNCLERFKATMGGHVPEEAISRYFEAQSVWDETMATVATDYIRANPQQVLVIIVGDFHAIYGGGLPDRLKARGAKDVVVVSQVNLSGLNSDEENAAILPDPNWGPRGDYVWAER